VQAHGQRAVELCASSSIAGWASLFTKITPLKKSPNSIGSMAK
jgi:hypothetical protein